MYVSIAVSCAVTWCCRSVFSVPKSIQATVTLLESLHVILEKTPRDDIRAEVLPMLYNAFESTTIQVQVRPARVPSPVLWVRLYYVAQFGKVI